MPPSAGKHVFCEKPMTKFIAEGRAVVEACKKNKVVFQIGTFSRFGDSHKKELVENHKIFKHGLLKDAGGTGIVLRVQNRTGRPDLPEEPVPANLDYDMWLGPAPYKPYNAERVHYQNRFYWDYEGGDLTNFGSHQMDPNHWIYGKDETAPVKAEPYAPWPQHPDAVGKYGWVELTYADGLKIVISGTSNWGKPYDRSFKRTLVSAADLDEEGRKKLAALPDRAKDVDFRGSDPGGQGSGRRRRVVTPRHHGIAPGQHRHSHGPHDQLRSGQGANRWRRAGQPAGEYPHAGTVAPMICNFAITVLVRPF